MDRWTDNIERVREGKRESDRSIEREMVREGKRKSDR